jgi:hypothetical protein
MLSANVRETRGSVVLQNRRAASTSVVRVLGRGVSMRRP